jgi:hypothetical protein
MREVPGTWEIGQPPTPMQVANDERVLAALDRDAGLENVRGFKTFVMGACTVLLARERAGKDGEFLWHMSISHPERHPTWDEIKAARYWLLSNGLCFGILLPPPEYYVNIEAQDHVFHLWEITDPRAPWEEV